MKGYPRWFSARLITSVCTIAFLSGALLLPTTFEMRLEWEVPWRLANDHRTWVVAFHVLCGYVLVSVLGALWSIHMRVGWRRKQKQTSGALLVFISAFLAVTGIGIYYLANEKAQAFDSLLHAVAGVILLPLYVRHLYQKKSVRER